MGGIKGAQYFAAEGRSITAAQAKRIAVSCPKPASGGDIDGNRANSADRIAISIPDGNEMARSIEALLHLCEPYWLTMRRWDTIGHPAVQVLPHGIKNIVDRKCTGGLIAGNASWRTIHFKPEALQIRFVRPPFFA